MFDVLVVGGGPAGSLSAILLSKKGYNVLIAEEHASPGFPVQCAGLISERCFEEYSKYVSSIKKTVEKRIDGAFFVSPSGFSLEAKGKAYVIERKLFDRILFEKASFYAETSVKSKVEFGKEIRSGGKKVTAKNILGADGVYSSVAKHFKFERPRIYTCLQVETKFKPLDERYVELYFGKSYSDLFAYVIPLEDTAKLGVICRNGAAERLKKFMKHRCIAGRVGKSTLELIAGAIPDRLVSFVKENVALIGDSAGMVKPYTGGGLNYLLIAAEVLAKNFPNLKNYEKEYRRKLWKEYEAGKLIRKIYSMEEKYLDDIFLALKDFDFSGIDMDNPSTIIKKIPELLRVIKPKNMLRILRMLLS
ncbi:MAG: NAD(P)/FAD-dependent oxidoreductase [Archaeoglobales archaeon]|nr:NAD(P)/FAD-dependent oxidoreductase [Archaeoglobales archaeon]